MSQSLKTHQNIKKKILKILTLTKNTRLPPNIKAKMSTKNSYNLSFSDCKFSLQPFTNLLNHSFFLKCLLTPGNHSLMLFTIQYYTGHPVFHIQTHSKRTLLRCSKKKKLHHFTDALFYSTHCGVSKNARGKV